MLLFTLVMTSACGGGGGSSAPTEPAAAAPQGSTGSTPTPPPPPPAPTPTPAKTDIRVLALYSPQVAERYSDPALRAAHLFNVANDILRDSAVDLDLRLVAVEPVPYPDTGDLVRALDDLTNTSHPSLAPVPALRDQHQADLVTLLHPYANDGRCGIAWVTGYNTDGDFSGSAGFGYSVVAASCSDYTLLHEIGHNLGLAHSRREEPDGGSLPFGTGYGVEGRFVTIMASPSLFSAPRLPRLSNPLQQCEGMPCGVSASNVSRGADAASAINHAKDQVAAFR